MSALSGAGTHARPRHAARRTTIARVAIGAFAFSTILFVPQAHAPAPVQAACGTNWNSRSVPPPTIKVLRTGTGRVQTVDFRRYVAIVMASGEWPSRLRKATLEAGALATKQYAWYYTLKGNHRRSYKTRNGTCYDVRDDTRDQLFRPGRASPKSKQQAAIDATWALTVRKYGRFFLTGYRAGTSRTCAADATGWKLFARSVEACARKGWSRTRIQKAYYNPGLSFVWTEHVLGPVLSRPTVRLRSGSKLASRPARISWSKIASNAPVKAYKVQQRIGNGPWQNVTLRDPKATSVTVGLKAGRTHQFRVHAVDADGERGRWAASPTRKAMLKGPRDTTLSGKSVEPSDGLRGRARLKATFRSVAYVAPVGPGMGKAIIRVNGKKVKVIDLGSPEASDGLLVWTHNWRTARKRTIVVEPVRSNVRVDIDGFLALR